MAERLDLDAEVFTGYLPEATALVREVTAGADVRRIADLGCGTGTGTLALARTFPDADLHPVDAAEAFLSHVMTKAAEQGLADRIHPVPADLDEDWPPLPDLDLVWASASIHHLADPEAALARIRSMLVPGGWLALIEVDDPLRFQPMFLPGPQDGPGGLEARARAALLPEMTAAMPYLGADWCNLLPTAGFTVVADRVFELALKPPLPAATVRYAELNLRRLREQLRALDREDQLTAEDLAELDALVSDGPGGVEYRTDLSPRTRRHLWVARRP
jgi:SAM-dependent methyltransferase